MSWLRNHFYNWVFPGLQLLYGNFYVTADHIRLAKPFWPKVPADYPFKVEHYFCGKRKMPSEIRALHYYCTASKIAFPLTNSTNDNSRYCWDTIRKNLLSAEAKRKELDCDRLLLTGRDMWLFEVLSQKLGLKTIYIPEISRNIVRVPEVYHGDIASWLKKQNITGRELFVDTGFVGSIPRGLSKILNNYSDIKYEWKVALVSQDPRDSTNRLIKPIYDRKPHPKLKNDRSRNPEFKPNQIFPNRKTARNEALIIERLPHYCDSGFVESGEVFQKVNKFKFIHCAIVTSLFWRGIKDNSELKIVKKQSLKKQTSPKKKINEFSFTQDPNYVTSACICISCVIARRKYLKLKKKFLKRKKYKRLAKKAKNAA